MHMFLTTIRSHARPLLGLFLACVAVLSPTFLQGGAMGHPISDMPDHYWGSWFFGENLLAGNWPDHSSITHLPEGGRLWIVDPIGGFLMLILRPLGFPAAWNVGLFIQILAACWAGYWLGWSQLQEKAPAFLVGLACGLSPFALGLLHSGLSEYAGLCWPPLFLASLLLAYKKGTGGTWPGILLFLATLQAITYGLFGWLAAACLVAGPGAKGRMGVFFKMSTVWGLLTLPLALWIKASLGADDSLINESNAPGWSPEQLPITDLMTWFRPGEWVFPPTPELGNPGILHVNSLGLLLLGLAIIGWVRTQRLRPLRWGSAFFAIISLGPRLSWGGSATPILLPMAVLYILPFSIFDSIHHPYRITAFLMPLVALWAAAGLSTLSKRAQIALPILLLGEWLFLCPAPWPIHQTPLPDVSTHLQAPAGAILDFPPDMTEGNRTYLMGQVEHKHPIAYGINRFLSPQLKSNPVMGKMLRCLKHPERLARNRDIFPREPVLVPLLKNGPTLKQLGFNSIVLHKQSMSLNENNCLASILKNEAQIQIENPQHDLWLTR